jgi:hypothetical protein
MLSEGGFIGDAGGWWAQSVTVGYEHAKGRRVKGETADAGFQVGVQKMLPIDASTLWSLLVSADGLRLWLGDLADAIPLETRRARSSRGYTKRSADSPTRKEPTISTYGQFRAFSSRAREDYCGAHGASVSRPDSRRASCRTPDLLIRSQAILP